MTTCEPDELWLDALELEEIEERLIQLICELDANSANELVAWMGFSSIKAFRPEAYERFLKPLEDNLESIEFVSKSAASQFPGIVELDRLSIEALTILFHAKKASYDWDGAYELALQHVETVAHFADEFEDTRLFLSETLRVAERLRRR